MISVIETSNISNNVNINATVADKLVDYLFGELSSVNTRNNMTYSLLNKLLCVNYGLASYIKAKAKNTKVLFSLEDIKTFINDNFTNNLSLTTSINALMRAEEFNTDNWCNYLGYNPVDELLFEDHQYEIENMFNIIFKHIKNLFPNYANVYSEAISKSLTLNAIKPLFEYEKALHYLLTTQLFEYKINDTITRNKMINYLFYHFGFDVVQYNTAGKIVFKIDSGVINPDIAEYLMKLEHEHKSKKYDLHTLINILSSYIFINDGSKPSYCSTFLENLIGKVNYKLQEELESSGEHIATLLQNGDVVFGLSMLQDALQIRELIDNKRLNFNNNQIIITKLNTIIDICKDELNDNPFIAKFGEYLLLK